MSGHESWKLEPGAEIAPGRTVLGRIGGGNRYEVHLVWDDHYLSIMVAKLLRPDRTDDEDARRGMLREAAALERLGHPVLLRGFGAAVGGPYPHVLVEHLEGPTLRSLIRRHGPLGLQQSLPLIMSVASVIHYLAAEGWVHLDVKPDNLIMGIPPRLIDLSLARTVEDAERTDSSVGTRAYMPPEQCAPGELGTISPAADVWGLGATAFHAIAGRPPFEPGTDSGELAERYPQVASEPAPLPSRVPPALADVVKACLRREPAERPTAAEVLAAIEPLAVDLPRRLLLGRRGPRLV